jgi:hypothetical protein
VKSIDVVIEEYRQRMFSIAKEDGLDSHQTLVASQYLDQLLYLKMTENLLEKNNNNEKNSNIFIHQ